LCFLLVSSIIEPTYGAGRQAGAAPTEKGLDNTMKLGIGVQTPDFISPYFSINAAKA
jgi:hypothetical protein